MAGLVAGLVSAVLQLRAGGGQSVLGHGAGFHRAFLDVLAHRLDLGAGGDLLGGLADLGGRGLGVRPGVGLFGLGALFSLWGALYWRSQSMRQLPQAEIDGDMGVAMKLKDLF